MTPFVKRAHFDMKIMSLQGTIRKLIRRNQALVKVVANIAASKKHYLKVRLKGRPGYMRYKKELISLLAWKKRWKKNMGSIKLMGNNRTGEPRYLFNASRSEYKKLRYILKKDYRNQVNRSALQ